MTLPSGIGGRTTSTIGFFDADARTLASWFRDRLGDRTEIHPSGCRSLADAIKVLESKVAVSRRLWVPIGAWSGLLTNGPLGTDVGVLPSRVARHLGCRAIRAVSTGDDVTYPARILEVYGPDGEPGSAHERSIVAANDGGRWVFETSGEPYPFEDQVAYTRRRKATRFTDVMLFDYLRALGVPVDTSPDWQNSYLVELKP